MTSPAQSPAPQPGAGGGTHPETVWLRLARAAVPVASVLLFLVLAAYRGDRPLHLDSVDFQAAAEAVVETGVPIYYRGEWTGRVEEGEWAPGRWSGARLEKGQWAATYHPPLYVHLLAGWFLLLGAGALQARLFGALCAVLACWLTVRLARQILGERSRRIDWAVWPVVLLQAYTLRASGILDIDTSVYGPLLLLLALTAVRAGARVGLPVAWWEVAVLGTLTAFALWAKLTTVLLVVAALPLLLRPRLSLARAMLVVTAALGVALVLFHASFLTYCLLADLDPRDTYRFLVASFQRGGAVPPYLANLAATGPFVVRWTGLLPWAAAPLALTSWYARACGLAAASSLQLRVLVGTAIAGSLYYMAQTRTFGNAPFKYVLVFWPLVLLPLASLTGLAAARLIELRRAGPAIAVASGALFAGAAAARSARDEHLQLVGEKSVVALTLLVVPAALALVAAGLWRARGPGRGPTLLWLAAAALHLGFQAGVAGVQARAPYSTDYDYGQMGMEEAIAFVRASTNDDEIISSMKDLAIQARRPFIETYLPLYVSEAAAADLVRAWEDGTVSLIVFTEGIGQDQAAVRPILAEWLASNAELVASPGHYRIYRPLRRTASGGTTR